MVYRKIKPYNLNEEELRALWLKSYCENPIITFDEIAVRFFPDMFDHCFYESENRKKKDKSILSYNRLEKIFWIKDALEDTSALLKIGWDSKRKKHDSSRRVALVKGNYIVIIQIIKEKKAKFITAFEMHEDKNLELIKKGPDWKKMNAD